MQPHHRSASRAFSYAVLIATISPSVIAAQSIQGRLLEQGSGRPLPSAVIMLVSGANAAPGASTKSDSAGRFLLRVPAGGIYRVRVEDPGYRTAVTPEVEVGPGDQLGITLHLLPDTLQLRPMQVTAASRPATRSVSGFTERAKRRAGGAFITRDQIDKRHPMTVSDLLATVPGLQVVTDPLRFGADVRTTEGCRPQVYLDGVRYPLRGETIDQIVSPSQLEGIEVYPHAAEVPIEFQAPGSTCGAILLWTRGF
jgi:hypothetical protein